jgi:2-hydroxycyclohexanecarboxyl-CoA dehydrogenase
MAGKAGIVVGGTGGIGRALCRALVADGADLVVGYHSREETARSLEAEGRGLGREVRAVRCDVLRREDIEAIVRTAGEAFGRIDFFVTTVGVDKVEWFLRQGDADIDLAIDLEFRSVVYCYREVLNVMAGQGHGRLLTIASDSGKVGSSGMAVSSGARGAVIAFTKAIAREMARYGITANVLCPGPTDTELNRHQQDLSEAGAKVIGALNRMVPLGRMARPEEVALPALLLLSDEGAFITGQAVSVSGGLVM